MNKEQIKPFISFNISAHVLKLIVFLTPFMVVLSFFLLKKVSDYNYPRTHFDLYLAIVNEDRLAECFQAIFYLISSIIAANIALKFKRNGKRVYFILYFLLALGLLVLFGEEISWGQRIFHIVSPEFFIKNSTQHEINVHNLGPIQKITRFGYISIGLYGSMLWIAKSQLEKFSIRKYLKYILPNWYLSPYFFPAASFYFYYYYILPINNFLNFSYHESEVSELLLSMGFVLFLSIKYFEQLQEYGMNTSNIIRVNLNE